MSLLQAILSVQTYVFLKSWNDSIYIKNRKIVPTHGLEFVMVAVVSTIAGMGYSRDWIVVAAFDLLMTAVTWTFMDIELNAFLLQNWITYQGSGWWDNWFKAHTSHPVRAMWTAKVALLLVSTVVLRAVVIQ